MLRLCLLLSLVLNVSIGYHVENHHYQRQGQHYSQEQHQQFSAYYGDDDRSVMDLIKEHGYPAENYTVQTVDGYKLDLIRIPHGLQSKSGGQYYQSSSESSEEQQQQSRHNSASQSSESNSKEGVFSRREPVLLMPGIISNAEDFVLGGPGLGLAFILADNGFDVFLGNVRGSKYGRRHTTLDPEHDPAFWNFCMDDMAVKDLPAIIDRILMLTRRQKIASLGQMQGSSLFYAMLSEMPRYNDKIRVMVTLGPLAFLGRTRSPMIKLVKDNMESKGWIVRNLGTSVLKPSEDLIGKGGGNECSQQSDQTLCKNIYFLLNGYDSRRLNMTTVMPIVDDRSEPTGVAVKGMLQLAHWAKTGHFTKYCLGTIDYDLRKVTTPVLIFYTPNDMMSTEMDVQELARSLGGMKRLILVREMTNNLDLLFGKRVEEIVYPDVIRILKNME